MRTGTGEVDMAPFYEAADDIFRPVMESSVVLAGHYAKACGRSIITPKDISLGLMYAARNVAGKQMGSLYPEIYDEEEEEEEEEDDEEEDEEEWTEYTGEEDDLAAKMNECARTFEEWEPEEFYQKAIKSAALKARDSLGSDLDQTE
jgi:hypothetical protein